MRRCSSENVYARLSYLVARVASMGFLEIACLVNKEACQEAMLGHLRWKSASAKADLVSTRVELDRTLVEGGILDEAHGAAIAEKGDNARIMAVDQRLVQLKSSELNIALCVYSNGRRRHPMESTAFRHRHDTYCCRAIADSASLAASLHRRKPIIAFKQTTSLRWRSMSRTSKNIMNYV